MNKRIFLLLSLGLFTALHVIAMHEYEELPKPGMSHPETQKNNQLMNEKSEALNEKNNSYNIKDLPNDTVKSWIPSASMKDGITWTSTKIGADGTKTTVHKTWSGNPVKTIIVHPADKNEGGLKINSSTEITHNADGTHTIVNTVSAKGHNTTESTGTYKDNENGDLTGHISEKKYTDGDITTTSKYSADGSLVGRTVTNKKGESLATSTRGVMSDTYSYNDVEAPQDTYNTDGSFTRVKYNKDSSQTTYHANSKQDFDQGKLQSMIQKDYTSSIANRT